MYKAKIQSEWVLSEDILVSEDQLAEFAADPDCSNAKECLELLEKRKSMRAKEKDARAKAEEAEQDRRSKVSEELQSNPFDPRNEVSADARHIAQRIVKHLWIIFVALPFVLGILYLILFTLAK